MLLLLFSLKKEEISQFFMCRILPNVKNILVLDFEGQIGGMV